MTVTQLLLSLAAGPSQGGDSHSHRPRACCRGTGKQDWIASTYWDRLMMCKNKALAITALLVSKLDFEVWTYN